MDDAILGKRRPQTRQRVNGRPAPNALVGTHRAAFGGHRNDLVIEGTAILCGRGQFVAARSELVEISAAQAHFRATISAEIPWLNEKSSWRRRIGDHDILLAPGDCPLLLTQQFPVHATGRSRYRTIPIR